MKMPSASCSEKVAATFLCPLSCGFAWVAALILGRQVSAELVKEEKEGQAKFCARKLQEHYKQYTELFKDQDGAFLNEFNKFRKKLPWLKDFFKSWNPRQKVEKEKYLNHFSPESWSQLPPERKKEYSLADCTDCQKQDAEFQVLFPARSKQFKGKTNKENNLSFPKATTSKSHQFHSNNGSHAHRPTSRKLQRVFMTGLTRHLKRCAKFLLLQPWQKFLNLSFRRKNPPMNCARMVVPDTGK